MLVASEKGILVANNAHRGNEWETVVVKPHPDLPLKTMENRSQLV